MLALILLAVTSCIVSADEQCPTKYARFSTTHSFCLPPNRTCHIVQKGVVDAELKREILMAHNELRSKVAMGNEKRAGGLPEASNMMEMEWDDELAAVAEKWAFQCYYEHDNGKSRAVERFVTGQNLGITYKKVCQDLQCMKKFKKLDWKGMINAFYGEVDVFKRQLVEKYKPGKPMYGHFTQVIWATTWKVGCGHLIYIDGPVIYKYYACNYGPAGNVIDDAVYKPGKPCTGCPDNTCCGDCAVQEPTYTGLCQVVNKTLGPLDESKREGTIVDCNWKRGEPTCNFQVNGKKDWIIKPSLDGGPYYSIKLNGGEESSLKLMTTIKPKAASFCLRVEFRKSAADAANKDSSVAVADLSIGKWHDETPLETSTVTHFGSYLIALGWNSKTQVVIKISVPKNAPEHIFDLRKVVAYDGECPEE